MAVSKPKTFRAVLERSGEGLNWVIARVPFDPAEVWPVRQGRRVRGEINGFAFRTSLFPGAGGKKHIVLVNKKMQAGARAMVGDTAQFRLEPDLEEREAVVPAELAKALKADRGLSRKLLKLEQNGPTGSRSGCSWPWKASRSRPRFCAPRSSASPPLAMAGKL
jgi:hypothetical protein